MESKLIETVVAHFEQLTSEVDIEAFLDKLMNLVKEYLNNQVFDGQQMIKGTDVTQNQVVKAVVDSCLKYHKKGVLEVLINEYAKEYADVLVATIEGAQRLFSQEKTKIQLGTLLDILSLVRFDTDKEEEPQYYFVESGLQDLASIECVKRAYDKMIFAFISKPNLAKDYKIVKQLLNLVPKIFD